MEEEKRNMQPSFFRFVDETGQECELGYDKNKDLCCFPLSEEGYRRQPLRHYSGKSWDVKMLFDEAIRLRDENTKLKAEIDKIRDDSRKILLRGSEPFSKFTTKNFE
jgi:hypothetical protein